MSGCPSHGQTPSAASCASTWTMSSVWETKSSTNTLFRHYKRNSKLGLQIPTMFSLWDTESAGRRKVPTLTSKLIKQIIEELGDIEFDQSPPDTDYCSPALHSQCRSVLGQVNWLQSRAQSQACYRFSRCASASASPTIVDVRALNKVALVAPKGFVTPCGLS